MKRLNLQIKYLIFSLIHLGLGLSFILSNTYADLGLKDKWYRHLEKEQGGGAELSGQCLPKGRVEVEASRVKAAIPSITFAEISAIVDQLRLNPTILTPEQKAANLFLFYDIIKVAYVVNEVFPDGRIIGKAIEGVRIIWSDSGISDELLEDTMGQYFVYSPIIDWRLRMHFIDEINHFFVPRPLRYVSILSKTAHDSIFKRLLLENADLKYFSSPISLGANSPETRTAFNYSLLFLDLLSRLDVDKLTINSRNYLLESTIDLIEKVPWLNQYAIYDDRDIILNNVDFDYRNAVRDQVALHIARIFDLNPITNEQSLSDTQRLDIKKDIKNAFNLSGIYAQSWDELTILLSPGYFADGDAPKEFYYRLFKAYPSVPILLGSSRLHFGGFHYNWVDANSPNDVYYAGSGVIEGTVHGVSHNVASYLFRHQQVFSRWEELVRRMNFNCNQDLHAVYFFNRCATPAPPPGAGYWAWPERLADNILNYTINTDRIFGLALEQFDKGYTNPIDMFLFMTGVFSVDISSRLSSFQTNVGRFFYVPDDYWYNFDPEKTIFTLTSIPLTRNNQNQITSLIIHERKYNFDLDTNGNVLNYTIEDISVPTTVSITEPLDNQEVEDTVTIRASASDGRGVHRVEFYIDNTLHSADNTSPYESSWDTKRFLDGSHSLKAKVYDDAANSAQHSITVRVNNAPPPPPKTNTLTVSKSGDSSGIITSDLPGINCGFDCQESYNQGTPVTLTAIPDINSTFSNWQGDCSGTNNTCTLMIDSNKSVTAVFDKKPIDQPTCSAGSVRACIDSISPNPADKGETITFTGHGENDNNEPISKYRWRLDRLKGRTLIGKEASFSTNIISPGTHTIYFRVSVGKSFGGWSEWISKELVVNNFTTTPVCGNNICESGETLISCPKDCFAPPKPQCSDGIDNDNDNKIDYPTDPGCISATDNDERDLVIPPPTNVPAAPSSVFGQVQFPNRAPFHINISWRDNSNNETKFEIERSKSDKKDWIKIAEVLNDITRYSEITGNKSFFYYRVRACNISGCSDYAESNLVF